MSGANHVAGGIVFTGIYLSMFDVNIYEKPHYLGFAIFFALLPDIDHTKSIVGKMFYPVAKYLDRKFGHRTLTHSLLAYFVGALTVGAIEKIWFSTTTVTSIFLWAYASHLILDMLTVQGVPLLYPFKKNPCVIPGNPKFRLRGSDFKTESIAFVLFVMVAFSTKDLFARGFWNSYDRLFGTVKSVHAETMQTDRALFVKYAVHQDGKDLAGAGWLVNSTPEHLLLFDQSAGFLKIGTHDHVRELVPIRTRKVRQISEISFSGIGMDSLQKILKNRTVLTLKLQAELPIRYTKDNQPQSGTSVVLENVFNPVLVSSDLDSVDAATEREISLVRLELEAERQKQALYQQQKSQVELQYKQVLNDLQSSDYATQEKAIREKERVSAAFTNISAPVDQRPALLVRLNYLQSKLHVKRKQSISGYIKTLAIK